MKYKDITTGSIFCKVSNILPLDLFPEITDSEVLCKILTLIKQLIEAGFSLEEAWEQFQEEFQNNLSNTLINILNEWISTGTFDEIINEYMLKTPYVYVDMMEGVNDTEKLINAINTGNTVYFSKRVYNINSNITLPSGCLLYGMGSRGTTLNFTGNINLSNFSGIKNISIIFTGENEYSINMGVASKIDDAFIRNAFNGIKTNASCFISNVTIEQCKQSILFNNVNDVYLINVIINSTINNAFGLVFAGAIAVECINVNVLKCTVSIQAATAINRYCAFTNCYFDSCSNSNTVNLERSWFSSCWFSNRGNNALNVAGNNITITNSFISGSSPNGLFVSGSYCIITNNQFQSNNAVDIVITETSDFNIISGNMFTNNDSPDYPNSNTGISVRGSTEGNMIITNNMGTKVNSISRKGNKVININNITP